MTDTNDERIPRHLMPKQVDVEPPPEVEAYAPPRKRRTILEQLRPVSEEEPEPPPVPQPPPAPQPPSLPLDRHHTVQAGLAAFQQIATERDQLRNELAELQVTIVKRDVEIEQMKSLHSLIESRINTALLQRDEAIAHRAAYEAFYVVLRESLDLQRRMFDAFKVPAPPLLPPSQQQGSEAEPAS